MSNNVVGTSEADELFGTDATDHIWGSFGDDTIYGGHGNDTVFGDEGNDLIIEDQVGSYDFEIGSINPPPASGDDFMFGGDGNDFILGGLGNDTLIGGYGQDTLFGGLGDDELIAYWGNDALYGGSGDDTLFYGGSNGTGIYDGGEGYDIFAINPYSTIETRGQTSLPERVYVNIDTLDNLECIENVLPEIEVRITVGGDFDLGAMELVNISRVYGDQGDNVLTASDNGDFFSGAGGNDTLVAGGGNDTLAGGHGDDTFIFSSNSGDNIVMDYDVHGDDVIDLQNTSVTGIADLSISVVGGGSHTLIAFEDTSLLVRNTSVTDFTVDDFLFA